MTLRARSVNRWFDSLFRYVFRYGSQATMQRSKYTKRFFSLWMLFWDSLFIFRAIWMWVCVINYVYGYWLSLDFVNESYEKYLILLPSIFNSNEYFSFGCLHATSLSLSLHLSLSQPELKSKPNKPNVEAQSLSDFKRKSRMRRTTAILLCIEFKSTIPCSVVCCCSHSNVKLHRSNTSGCIDCRINDGTASENLLSDVGPLYWIAAWLRLIAIQFA